MIMDEYSKFDEFESASQRGGIFPGLLLPPLMVIIVGLLISLISSGIAINQSVNAESFNNVSNPSNSQNNGNITGLDLSDSSQGILALVFTPEVHYWSNEIARWSMMSGLDMNMIATVMQIESCGDPFAISGAGAMGLFQVMPFHFLSDEDPFNPETNAIRGLSYLKKSLEASNGDVRLAFAGYNGGISIINRSEDNWALETQHYAYWASGIYSEASQDIESSDRLQEWLGMGGTSLCNQAEDWIGMNP